MFYSRKIIDPLISLIKNPHSFTLKNGVICLAALGILCSSQIQAHSQTTTLTPPPGSENFGTNVTILTNGNLVVADPLWDTTNLTDAGAVYLYDGATFNLISKLRGSTSYDMVGSGGITTLPNGNFIVLSPNWNVNMYSGKKAGAVTWVNGKTGLTDSVSAANSLVGGSDGDNVGSVYIEPGVLIPAVTVLTNGNFVVNSQLWKSVAMQKYGAASWGSGTTGIHGSIDTSNSLIGLNNSSGHVIWVTALSNGNYVVTGNNGGYGSVTWGNGNSGVKGIVDSTNSFVGAHSGDHVGYSIWRANQIYPLSNGNYVINSPYAGYINASGAVTWADGSKPIAGHISNVNSLLGNAYPVEIKSFITTLPNGNFVVSSPYWYAANTTNNYYAGAVTWVDGTKGLTGYVSASNSLIGSRSNDNIGANITVLANSNYLVQSPNWTNGSKLAAGAVTLGDGSKPLTGYINSTNSLVGSSAGDSLGCGNVISLANGNYVVANPLWDNGSIPNAGAVTWIDAAKGTTGTISSSNSLVGSSANDSVGNGGLVALANGNYVVRSPYWDNGAKVNAGAATWCNGILGRSGAIAKSNSLIGGSDSDRIGSAGISALKNGNYVVASPTWQNLNRNVGAATWGNGSTGISGLVSEANSLMGTSYKDQAATNVIPLANGNYLVENRFWENYFNNRRYRTALTWCSGTSALHGVIDTNNSLNDYRYYYFDPRPADILPLSNGDFIVKNNLYSLAVDLFYLDFSGCTTYGNGNGGTTGTPNTCNSIFGLTEEAGPLTNSKYSTYHDYLVVGIPLDNRVVIWHPLAQDIAEHNDSARHGLSENVIASVSFLNESGCRLIASILPIEPHPLNGNVTSVAFVEKKTPMFQNSAYVRRHFDISPDSASDEATNRITLYFNQSDFSDYNRNNNLDPDLPNSANDFAGKNHLRIIQETGTSSTGHMGSYTSVSANRFHVINPIDSNILWNSRLNRWEITVDVRGFGGFFVYGGYGSTKIDELNSGNTSGITASPIPTSSELFIRVNDPKLIGQSATISDIHGRQLQQFLLEKNMTLNIQKYPSGVYFLHCGNGPAIKILKQ
jgi:hypothetical protein